MVVDKFTPVVRVDSKQWKRQSVPYIRKRFKYPSLRLVFYCLSFGPSRTDVCYIKGLGKIPSAVASIMAHQINLHKTRTPFIPFRKCPYRDLAFQQCPRLRQRPALQSDFLALLLKQTIDRRGTYAQKLLLCVLIKHNLTMAL